MQLSVLRLLCSVSFLALTLAPRCTAQLASTYNSITTDGTYIYTSVTVDGSMSGSWPPGTQHTYSAYNVIGSVGGWISATHGLGYGSVVNNQQVRADDGGAYTWNQEATVECTIAGTFFDDIEPVHTYSIRLSAYIFNGLSNGRCTWVPTCPGKCSSQHTTNTNQYGTCFTTGPYLQCFDLLQDGNCWSYRVFCYGKSSPGICTN
jgi:hypothetical protein